MCNDRKLLFGLIFLFSSWVVLSASGSVLVLDAPPGMRVVSSYNLPSLHVIDFNQDGNVDLQFWTYPGGADACIADGGRLVVVTSRPDRPWGGLAPLDEGDLIGATFSRLGVSWYSGFPVEDRNQPLDWGVGGQLLAKEVDMAIESNAQTSSYFRNDGFVGVEFLLQDGVHYGWVEIKKDESSPWGGTITRWAWETEMGKSISAGLVPEPGELVLLTLGVHVLLLKRCRQMARS